MKVQNVLCMAALMSVSLTASAFAEQIANPAYTAWAKCKPGTTITMKTTSEMVMPADAPPGLGGDKSESTVTTKLVSVAADKVVVEATTTIMSNGQSHDLPAQKQEIPAKIGEELLGSAPTHGTKPSIPSVKTGAENLDVAGKTIATVTKEFTMESRPGDATAMTATMKIWTSPDVPGGMVKTQMHMTAPITVSNTSTLTDYKIATQ